MLGERDACLVSDRLCVEDMGFDVAVIDPAVDLAEQLDRLLNEAGQVDDLLVYASVLVDVDLSMDCFFCLDPAQPEIGDAVENIALALEEHHTGTCLTVVEGRFSDSQADNRTIEEVCDSLVRAFEPRDGGVRTVELVVSMRPKDAHAERIPSRFTAALLEELDGFSAAATARKAYASAVQRADMGDWPHALRYVPADRASLSLLPPEPSASLLQAEPPPVQSSPSPPAVDGAIEPSPAGRESPSPPPASASEIRQEPSPSEQAESPAPAQEQSPSSPAAQAELGASEATVPAADVMPETVPEAALAVSAPEPPTPDGMRPRSGPHAVETATLKTAKGAVKTAKKRALRPPDPASERVASTGVTVSSLSKSPSVEAESESLPKVIIAKTADPRQRDTERNVDRKAIISEAKKLIAEGTMTPPDTALPPAGGLGDEFDDDISVVEIEPPATPDKPAPKKPAKAGYLSKAESAWTVADCIEAGDAKLADEAVDEALACFKRALGKLGTTSSPERAEVYVRMARVMRSRGKIRVAISNYDKALGIVPEHVAALSGVIELQVEQENWRAVQSCEAKFFGHASHDENTLFEQLLASGERWLKQEPDTAEQRFLRASELVPARTEPLQRLASLYGEQGKIERALDIEEQLAGRLEALPERARALMKLGDLCIGKGLEERAYAYYVGALEADPFLLEALEALATACAEAQEWGELERAYLKMRDLLSGQVHEDRVRAVLAEIYHRLALLYRDHLFDPQSALAFIEEQIGLAPTLLRLRLLAAEISEEVGNYSRQRMHLRVASNLDPKRAETYESLFRAAQGHDDLEQAFLAASALQALGQVSGPAHYVYQEHAVDGVPQLQRPMGSQGWVWLRVSTRDPTVDRVMRALAPAVLRARVGQLHREGKLAVPPGPRQDAEGSSLSAVRSLVWGCNFLGVPIPAIHLDPKQAKAFHAPFAKHRTTVVGKGALSGRSLGELGFLVGQHLALRLPEHELVAHMQSIEELTACFLAGLKITLGKTPPHSEDARVVDALAVMLQRELSPQELDYLKKAVAQFGSGSGRVDLRQWVLTVEKCVARTGFLLCGDLELAITMARSEGDTAFSRAEQRVDDLLSFSQSESNSQLRAALGCAIDG